MKKNTAHPLLVAGDGNGNIFEIPEFHMAGMSLNNYILPEKDILIPMPPGSNLFELPGRIPVGYDPRAKRFTEVPEYLGKPVFAVAAFMAPAYVQYYRSAYKTLPDAPRLPLYSYTAIGWHHNSFYVAGTRIDRDKRHDPGEFKEVYVNRKAQAMLKQYPGNRLVRHLVENCVCKYRCPNAQNFVLNRWECPVPVSTACNAGCLGCISSQPGSSGIPSSQDRLTFTPSVSEILEFTVPHLEKAPNALISFGQGCEGEPLLEGEILEEAIRAIRRETARGIINVNSNGSLPGVVERLCKAGLDSMRVSMNSAQESLYKAYYQPKKYTFDDVLETLEVIRHYKRWSSLNYFVFPGVTDHQDEIAALENVIDRYKINMIQTRNMNIDPEWYMDTLGIKELSRDTTGMPSWIKYIRKRHPRVSLGYFNPYADGILTETG